ncbi:MAG: hypothetical protein Q7R35_13265 [Elusimicrobiota bacterium]|nr:hypothetical protein [Elusimicrobiota bacterium]
MHDILLDSDVIIEILRGNEEVMEEVRFSDQAEGHLGAWRGVSRTKPRAVSEHAEGVTGRLRSMKS